MKRHSSFQHKTATLYIVSTPIGNMQDISLRAIDILKSVDIILAEDTRNSGQLLKYHGIDTPLKSYHEHNETTMNPKIIDRLKADQTIALISDAGTPLLSDPGESLVRLVRASGFTVSAIPGASALLAALVMSEHVTHPFTFLGFLPQKNSAKDQQLKQLKTHPYTMVFYESPKRISKTLKTMYDIFGNRNATIVRELTKLYEETITLTLNEHESVPELKGEIVLIVEGEQKAPLQEGDMVEHVELLIEDGHREMDAIKQVAKLRQLKKNKVYMAYHQHKSSGNNEE